MNTFGLNLSNALFKADRHIVVSLYSDAQTLYNRIVSRSNGKNGDGKRDWITIFRKQRQAMIAAKKWQSIGVTVLQFNTATITVDEEMNKILETIEQLCGENTTTR